MSAPSLCSALAIADSSTFGRCRHSLFGLKARMLSLTNRLATHQIGHQATFFLLREAHAPVLHEFPCQFLLLGLLAGGVTLERTGQRELAEFVTDHIFGNKDRNMLLAIVDRDRQTDELGRIVERRDQVLIGRLSLVARTASTLSIRTSTYGPF